MTDCVFCGIASGAIPATIVAEAEDWVAFRDLEPRAPVHVLVIPRAHVSSLAALSKGPLGTRLLLACAAVADAEGLDGGYRVVTNVGGDGGQAVPHLHFHVLGGRRMGWPPG
ncbi:MAG: HIT domain-containing protein [Gemmatimonadota bacterium]|uniref:HIT domain-containing protein n=1 Tax=Candidatus Palauibacter scopulicola TaxID=3056741 RepID=UPI00239CE37D|nr:HIT domain-containing protein [Candidatus Palauibacter scopulicola]MDE2663905.1 HIT domain-containing protein [Candidatus Palauibacter scopulicola]